jgi:vancomycin resistance protein YoaR
VGPDRPTLVDERSGQGVEDTKPWRGVEDTLARHRRWLIGSVALAFVAALYVADLMSGLERVSRGVVVAGVHLGGLDAEEAERRLRAALEPRTSRPVAVTAEELTGQLDPRGAGLAVDWAGTMARATDQPLNPLRRLQSFVAVREVPVASISDGARMSALLDPFAARVDRTPTEGSVRFAGLEPLPVYPTAGRRLDGPAAVRTVTADWLADRPVALPVSEVPASTTPEDVRRAIDTVARPSVSAPAVLLGDGVRATLDPEVIASALRFRVASGSGLVPELDAGVVTGALGGQLAATERPGRNASVNFAGVAPVVVPARDGRTIDYPATFRDLLGALARTEGAREVPVVYRVQPAKVSTDEVNRALAAGEISTFTTRGFAADSGRNIRRAAEMINGAVLGPGETFSLNAATNPRNAANGFVEAGIIEDGQPARGIGGGVSQVATTLYNAGYFAGMVDVEHREHSYYISRYPVAREATVFNDVIDVKFRNDTPGAVVIRTLWTPSSITVKILGAKTYEVTSRTGPRANPTPPPVTTSRGPTCTPSRGSPGFTATDTRTIRDIRTGQTRTETRTVNYHPSPTVVCPD